MQNDLTTRDAPGDGKRGARSANSASVVDGAGDVGLAIFLTENRNGDIH